MKYVFLLFLLLLPGFAFAQVCPSGTPGGVACEPFSTFINGTSSINNPTAADRQPYVQSSTTKFTPTSQPYNIVALWGADPTGVAAVDTAFSTAETYLCAHGGGAIYFPAGTYLFNNTATLTCSGTYIKGDGKAAVIIKAHGTSGSLIAIGTGSPVITGVGISGITLDGSSRTSGECIDVTGAAEVKVEDILSTAGCWNGMLINYINNVHVVRASFQNILSGSGGFGIKWYTPVASGNRSDVLKLNQVTINNQCHGSDGIVWDGADYTLEIQQTNVIRTHVGFLVQNTAASSSVFPQELEADGFDIDGASLHAAWIQAGWNFSVVNSVWSNTTVACGTSDQEALRIDPDLGASVTRFVHLANFRAENTQQEAMYVNAQNFYSTNSAYSDASQAGVGSYPAVEIGPNCGYCFIVGSKLGPLFGNPIDTSYGAKIDVGSTGVVLADDDFYGNVTGAVNDLTNGGARIIGGVDNSGNPIGPWVSGISTSGTKQMQLTNLGTTNTTASQLGLSTGTANAYLSFTQEDGSSPNSAIGSGPADIGGMSISTQSGPINLVPNGQLQVGGVAGVTCSGTPTSSFASVKGIVTHC